MTSKGFGYSVVLVIACVVLALFSSLAVAVQVDVNDRESVVQLYKDVNEAPLPPADWTGDAATCDQGATSEGFRMAVIQRVNFYRAMSGIPFSFVLYPGDPYLSSLVMISWTSLAATNKYRLLVRAEDGSIKLYTNWMSSASLGCAQADTCNYRVRQSFAGEKQWFVLARNSIGTTPWSAAAQFDVAEPPSV